MKIGVSVSLDVTKIDKSRMTQVTKKDGSTATYLNMTTFIDTAQQDQYENNGFIAQSQSKEEREAGEERPPILGNVKVFYTDGAAPQSTAAAAPITEDIPF
jgi:hypothetical protein